MPPDREDMPTGLKDLPPREPLQQICDGCGENLFRAPHGPRCPELATIFRLNVTNDARMRRHEDHLQACTRRAFKASLRAGGRP